LPAVIGETKKGHISNRFALVHHAAIPAYPVENPWGLRMRKILLVSAAALVAAIATAGDAVVSKASAQTVEQRGMFIRDALSGGMASKAAPAKPAKKAKKGKKAKKKASKGKKK
jgi:hypothetical protein